MKNIKINFMITIIHKVFPKVVIFVKPSQNILNQLNLDDVLAILVILLLGEWGVRCEVWGVRCGVFPIPLFLIPCLSLVPCPLSLVPCLLSLVSNYACPTPPKGGRKPGFSLLIETVPFNFSYLSMLSFNADIRRFA